MFKKRLDATRDRKQLVVRAKLLEEMDEEIAPKNRYARWKWRRKQWLAIQLLVQPRVQKLTRRHGNLGADDDDRQKNGENCASSRRELLLSVRSWKGECAGQPWRFPTIHSIFRRLCKGEESAVVNGSAEEVINCNAEFSRQSQR